VKYRVIVQPPAEAEVKEAYAYVQSRSPVDAARWVAGLEDAVRRLETFPGGFPFARERGAFRRELRQLVYGRGLTAYRILFTIADDEVHVLHVRRAARRGLRRI
jgi:plasmid stabilization system protein ParE